MAAQLMKNSEELKDESIAGRGGVGGLVTLGRGEIGIANEGEFRKPRSCRADTSIRAASSIFITSSIILPSM